LYDAYNSLNSRITNGFSKLSQFAVKDLYATSGTSDEANNPKLTLKRQYTSLAPDSSHIGVIHVGMAFVYCGFICTGWDYGSWIIWSYGNPAFQVSKVMNTWTVGGITTGSFGEY
jgi:hypothetical protein